jgi:hypothetical protein
MNQYIANYLRVIRNCSVDNTYKMAWAKAIVEISIENQNTKIISLEAIASKMFKYYWNQTIYFNLIQGSNLSKPPVFISIVKDEIEKYYFKTSDRQPVHFERIEKQINLSLVIKKLVSILKQDVSYRFTNLSGKIINLYEYQKGDNHLKIDKANLIAEYADILFESINFRWTQILENFNNAPKIARKVRVLDLPSIKRNSLEKFRAYLNIENPNLYCFICNKPIKKETPSIDHLIPWSFIFSDDLWNLVYTHKICNSSKSNVIPSEQLIKKLANRNITLFNKLKTISHQLNKKPIEELELAIEHNYVNKFWINCQN